MPFRSSARAEDDENASNAITNNEARICLLDARLRRPVACVSRATKRFEVDWHFMGHVKVVEAVEEDAPIILEMIRGLAEYEKLLHVVSATEQQIRDTLFGERPAAEVLLAWVDGECIGFALFFPNYSTFLAKPGLYLEDLFVKPHARGKGAGAALLRELARIARRRCCGRVEWAVLDWNAPSIAFYRKLGAVPMDEWTTFRLTGDALEGLAR
jgi:GNAT superfamily N-acetyltransferase